MRKSGFWLGKNLMNPINTGVFETVKQPLTPVFFHCRTSLECPSEWDAMP